MNTRDNEQIKTFCDNLAREVSERRTFNLEEVSTLIRVRLYDAFKILLEEYSAPEEREYQRLLELASKTKLGSKEYVKIGYQLSLAKAKKANVNRVLNGFRNTHEYSLLKAFVIDNYGQDSLNRFLESVGRTGFHNQKKS